MRLGDKLGASHLELAEGVRLGGVDKAASQNDLRQLGRLQRRMFPSNIEK